MIDDDGSGEHKVTLLGRIKDKLIASKEKTARERRLQSASAGGQPPDASGAGARDRLPPGQRRVDKWPVLDLGVTPKLDLADWRLTVDGLVDAPAAWGWQDFLALPQVDVAADIHCVTAWSLYDSVWGGVATREILERVRPGAEARFVLFRSYDGYTTNVPLSRFAEADALIAHRWNGQPIGPEHGGPARVVIPSLYFWKSAKWMRRITFAAEDQPGYWEVRGYYNDADPWREERYG
jgi:DMSO/TMAO reductase YedYZ molybdopterin-dependent catalytic subunit